MLYPWQLLFPYGVISVYLYCILGIDVLIHLLLLTPLPPSIYLSIHPSSSSASPPSPPHPLQNFPFLSFFSFSSLSFFPPRKISKCPAFSARNFSVMPTSPAAFFFLIWFCEMSDAFLGLMTLAPRRLGPAGLEGERNVSRGLEGRVEGRKETRRRTFWVRRRVFSL